MNHFLTRSHISPILRHFLTFYCSVNKLVAHRVGLLLSWVWMWSLLHKRSGTPFASFFWVLSGLIRLQYSQRSIYLSFLHHFSSLLLSRVYRQASLCLLAVISLRISWAFGECYS